MDQPTEASFLKDVAEHEMQVLMDNGVYRHVRFKRPGTGDMHFDLITYPGYLVYSGDMGCYVFSRLKDMFQFFRTDRLQPRNGQTLFINLGYWSEKLRAVDGTQYEAGATEFDEDRFKSAVIGDLISWMREHREETSKEDRRELWESVISEVIEVDGDSGGYRKQSAAHDFHFRINDEVGSFSFQDFWEHNLTRYTYRFVWCCYALAWGIQKYDEAKAVKYGCHCELDIGEKPDFCWIDKDEPGNCCRAMQLLANGNGRDDCEEWRPVALDGSKIERVAA